MLKRTSSVIVLGDKDFGKYVGHEGRALMDGIIAFIKVAWESSPNP